MNFTKKQRHEIYKKAFEIHKEDIKYSKSRDYYLFGMCNNIQTAILRLYRKRYKIEDLVDLPEFIALKPKNKTINSYWWDAKNTNRTRISKYKLIIKQTES